MTILMHQYQVHIFRYHTAYDKITFITFFIDGEDVFGDHVESTKSRRSSGNKSIDLSPIRSAISSQKEKVSRVSKASTSGSSSLRSSIRSSNIMDETLQFEDDSVDQYDSPKVVHKKHQLPV